MTEFVLGMQGRELRLHEALRTTIRSDEVDDDVVVEV